LSKEGEQPKGSNREKIRRNTEERRGGLKYSLNRGKKNTTGGKRKKWTVSNGETE